MEFKPSNYQEDIFEFAKYGYGNAVISAVAGSGKTSTMIKCLSYIKEGKKILLLAFNNSIVAELKEKIDRPNTDIKTLHSLGYSILRYNFKNLDVKLDEDKYLRILSQMHSLSHNKNMHDKKYVKNVLKLCDLGRFYLIKDEKGLKGISDKYGIVLVDNEIEIVKELIDNGVKTFLEDGSIDYTDMVYLPSAINVKALKYDLILIDEAQDLSESHMSLFMKCFKQGSRFLAVGDENQSINGFAGSSIESFNKLRNLPNTIELPLSICYRCGKNIVAYAKKIVSDIEPFDFSPDGYVDENSKIEDLQDGDMVICRNQLPLIKLYVNLINNNVKCYIKGVDIGLNLIELLESVNSDNLFEIYENLRESVNIYLNKENEDYNVELHENILEKIECLELIGRGLSKKSELIDKISQIFADEKKGICLSTIHKSKGLEADNVYILNRFLTPSKSAKKSWELVQEKNLEYVSYTRAKKKLGFIYLK